MRKTAIGMTSFYAKFRVDFRGIVSSESPNFLHEKRYGWLPIRRLQGKESPKSHPFWYKKRATANAIALINEKGNIMLCFVSPWCIIFYSKRVEWCFWCVLWSKDKEICCSEIQKSVGMTGFFKKSYKNTRTKKWAAPLGRLIFCAEMGLDSPAWAKRRYKTVRWTVL